MANLLDTIKKNRQALGSQSAPVEDQTRRVQDLLRAKSGQAGGSDTAISNVGEQAAADQTNTQMQGVQQQAQLQQIGDEQAASAQQQKTDTAVSSIDQARKFNTIQQRMQTTSILQDLSQQRGQLDLQKDGSRLEQAAFNLSMQDKKYTDQIQDIGRRRRLDNDAVFKDEMQKMAFGDSLGLVQQKLGDRDVLAASDRDYKKLMSDLTIDDAIKIAEIEAAENERLAALDREALANGAESNAAAANIQSQSQAYSGLLSGATQGIAAYGAYNKGGSTAAPTNGVDSSSSSSSLASRTA